MASWQLPAHLHHDRHLLHRHAFPYKLCFCMASVLFPRRPHRDQACSFVTRGRGFPACSTFPPSAAVAQHASIAIYLHASSAALHVLRNCGNPRRGLGTGTGTGRRVCLCKDWGTRHFSSTIQRSGKLRSTVGHCPTQHLRKVARMHALTHQTMLDPPTHRAGYMLFTKKSMRL